MSSDDAAAHYYTDRRFLTFKACGSIPHNTFADDIRLVAGRLHAVPAANCLNSPPVQNLPRSRCHSERRRSYGFVRQRSPGDTWDHLSRIRDFPRLSLSQSVSLPFPIRQGC